MEQQLYIEYEKTNINSDSIREIGLKIDKTESELESLLNRHSNISRSNTECKYERKFLRISSDITNTKEDFSINSVKINKQDIFKIVEGKKKILTLTFERPFLFSSENITITGNLVLKKLNKTVIARWPINVYIDSNSPYNVTIERIWYGRKHETVGPDLADTSFYNLDIESLNIDEKIIGELKEIEFTSPLVAVYNAHPEYVENGIPKDFTDNGYHILSRHSINFLTEIQKIKYKELFDTYIETSKRIAKSDLKINEKKRLLKSNFDSLLSPFGKTPKSVVDKINTSIDVLFNDKIENYPQSSVVKVSGVPTKADVCFDNTWTKEKIKESILSISNLRSSKDKWGSINSAGSGISILGERNGTNMTIFVDEKWRGLGKISTGYPNKGTNNTFEKKEIRDFYLNSVLPNLKIDLIDDIEYIIYSIPTPYYGNLLNLDG